MKKYTSKIVFILIFLFSGILKIVSQCPIVINEVMVSPIGGVSENCLYNTDTLNGGNPNLGLEWIELYNTNPCDSFDLSCYLIAFETSNGTGLNWGDFKLFGIIPPNGHFLIGGSNVPNADIKLTAINALHCSSKKWCLNDSAGWIGFYDLNSVPIDAVYWNIGGTAADLYTWPEYADTLITDLTKCTCCTSSAFENPSVFPLVEFAGNVIQNSSITFARVKDGSPIWGFGPVGGTPDICNGANNICNSVSINFSLTTPVCVGGNNGMATANVNTTTYLQSPFTYLWSTDSITQTINGLTSGIYSVTVTDKWGCPFIADTLLSEPPGLHIIYNNPICRGENLSLNSNISGLDYIWSGPNGFFSNQPTPVIASFQQNNEGYYYLTITNSDSCMYIDSVNVKSEQCYIEESNVITPNNDNINDYFIFNGLETYPNSQLVIFNRWGKKIYESSNYQNDWNGESCPDGVYYYILRLPENSERREITGWVTIIGKEN